MTDHQPTPNPTPAQASARAKNKQPRRAKMARIPHNYAVHKRPLLRPPPPSPYAGPRAQKVVYVGARTPFISAVKRVRVLLAEVEKRGAQAVQAKRRAAESSAGKKKKQGARGADELLEAAVDAVEGREEGAGARGAEEVLVKATGRSIEKALNLALFLQEKENVTVRVRTGTVTAIDDVEENGDQAVEGEGEEVPEARMRFLSAVEIGVALK